MKTFRQYIQEELALGKKITQDHETVVLDGDIVGIIHKQAPKVFAATVKLHGRFSPIGKFSSQDIAFEMIRKHLEKHLNKNIDQSRF